MKTVKTLPNQTIYDIAAMYYGTCEAVGELLMNNTELVNDPTELAALKIDYIGDNGFYVDVALLAGQSVEIDTQSPNMNRNIVKEITNQFTTYGTNN